MDNAFLTILLGTSKNITKQNMLIITMIRATIFYLGCKISAFQVNVESCGQQIQFPKRHVANGPLIVFYMILWILSSCIQTGITSFNVLHWTESRQLYWDTSKHPVTWMPFTNEQWADLALKLVSGYGVPLSFRQLLTQGEEVKRCLKICHVSHEIGRVFW